MNNLQRNFITTRISSYQNAIERNQNQAKNGSPLSSMAEDMACYYIAEAYEQVLSDLKTILELDKDE